MRKPGKVAIGIASGLLAVASAGCHATTHPGKFVGYDQNGVPVFEKQEYYSSGMNLNIAKKIVGGVLALGGLIDGNVDAFFVGADMASQPDLGRRQETNVYVNALPQQITPGTREWYQQRGQLLPQRPSTARGVDVYDNGASANDPKVLPPSFTCGDAEDRNSDGLLSRDEVKGLGSYFDCKNVGQKTQVCFGSAWIGVSGKTVAIKIFESATGRIIRADQESNPDWIREDERASFYAMDFYKGKGDVGVRQYAVEWFVGGRLMPERTVNFFVDYGEMESDSLDAE